MPPPSVPYPSVPGLRFCFIDRPTSHGDCPATGPPIIRIFSDLRLLASDLYFSQACVFAFYKISLQIINFLLIHWGTSLTDQEPIRGTVPPRDQGAGCPRDPPTCPAARRRATTCPTAQRRPITARSRDATPARSRPPADPPYSQKQTNIPIPSPGDVPRTVPTENACIILSSSPK